METTVDFVSGLSDRCLGIFMQQVFVSFCEKGATRGDYIEVSNKMRDLFNGNEARVSHIFPFFSGIKIIIMYKKLFKTTNGPNYWLKHVKY